MKKTILGLATTAILFATACQQEEEPCGTQVTCIIVDNKKQACDLDGDGIALPGECQLLSSDTTWTDMSVCDTTASLAQFLADRAAWLEMVRDDSTAIALEHFMPSHEICFDYLVKK